MKGLKGLTLEKVFDILHARAVADEDETAYLYDPRRGRVLKKFEGGRVSVAISRVEIADMGGCILIHNHPTIREAGFNASPGVSVPDCLFAMRNGLFAIVAISERFASVFIVPKSFSNEWVEAYDRLNSLPHAAHTDRELICHNVEIAKVPGVFNIMI